MNECPPGKILNHATGRCVNINGKIGKKIKKKQDEEFHTPQSELKPEFEDYRISNLNCEQFVMRKGWRMKRKLGEGVQGSAHQTCYYKDCDYVFKIVEFDNNASNYDGFVSEVEALKELNIKVPKCVPKMYGAWSCDNKGIIAMEMMYESKKLIPLRKIQSLLKRLESVGWLHVDTHRGNVMVRKNGEPVLIDFGYSQNKNKSVLNHPLNIDTNPPFTYNELKYLQNECFSLRSFGDTSKPSVKKKVKNAENFFDERWI